MSATSPTQPTRTHSATIYALARTPVHPGGGAVRLCRGAGRTTQVDPMRRTEAQVREGGAGPPGPWDRLVVPRWS